MMVNDYSRTAISTHTPLARRDDTDATVYSKWYISTHTPLARRDAGKECPNYSEDYFYSHASCEARLML